jgi:hypothetical protein
MIWDVLILVVVNAIIAVKIDAVKIDAVKKVRLTLAKKQRKRLIVPVSEMAAMIHAAEAAKNR